MQKNPKSEKLFEGRVKANKELKIKAKIAKLFDTRLKYRNRKKIE